MGGRGSGSGRGGGSESIGALKEREKSLNSQIDKLNKRLADYASRNPAWNMPSGYYDVQRKKQALESKKRSITNKIVTASRNVTVEKTNGKPFVNSFGEATKREITTTSYKNSQARLDKEIMRFVGGEINRKKQTKKKKMRKPDYAHKLTDKQLAELEQRIAKLYKEAADELTDTVRAYFEQFEKRDAAMKEKLDAGEITEQQYKQWRLAQMGRGKRFTALRDKVAERYTDANETAVAYVNDATPGIYSLNRNYAAYKIEQVSDKADFTLWDEQTVKRLIVEQPDLMPYYPPKRALQRGIDLKYGKQQITASITSSILQGKGIGKIADDLQSRMRDMNRASAIRTARTAVTGAQNAGRLDTYRVAQNMGIKLKKRWLAALDNRTRHAHAMLDGQTVDIDKPFKVDGFELMYPGDSSAPGYLVYNCRCTQIAEVDGEDTSSGGRRAIDPETGESVLVKDMTYAEWAGWKKEQAL